MLHAQINGKCSNQEDILTSTFFGHLELLGDPIWLIEILETFSQKEKRNQALFGDLDGVVDELGKNTKLSFEFWPKMSDGTEPDLLIICDNGNSKIPILFEIKYLSGLSYPDQLVEEYKNLIEKNWKKQSTINKTRQCRKGILIYLSKNKVDSIEEFEGSNEEIRDCDLNEENFPRIHLKWEEDIFRSLKELELEGHKGKILDKLKDYLRHLDLVPFDGFHHIKFKNIDKNNFYEFNEYSD